MALMKIDSCRRFTHLLDSVDSEQDAQIPAAMGSSDGKQSQQMNACLTMLLSKSTTVLAPRITVAGGEVR
jgi:hypothetical protein